jgi:hypothetical protein
MQPQHFNLGRWVRLAGERSIRRSEFASVPALPAPEGLLAFYVTSSGPIRKFAETARHNTDDHPLLEFHAPRELFSNTRDLNVGLLYDSKIGLLPQGAEIPDLQKAYGGMIAPLLHMGRSNLANQAMECYRRWNISSRVHWNWLWLESSLPRTIREVRLHN